MTGRLRRAGGVRLVVGALLISAATFASAAWAGHDGVTRYDAPFRAGPSGGDQFSYHSADSDGTVTVGRAYPVPGVINCTKGGPYAKLLVVHHAMQPVRRVIVTYDSAALDNFTFATVGLRSPHGRWYGTTTLRGVVTGSGAITLVPDPQRGEFPRVLVVEFGLQQSSACPNVDAGTIHFTGVRVVG
jgi:hypothetical protein